MCRSYLGLQKRFMKSCLRRNYKQIVYSPVPYIIEPRESDESKNYRFGHDVYYDHSTG